MKKAIIILLLLICTRSISYSQEKIEMKNEGGIYTIPCTVNDLRLRFIFDTGASDVSISAIEAAFMLKNGYLNKNDIINSQQYILADGSIEENAIINIKELKIGNTILTDIKACVSNKISAPLLLGQSAISKLGKWYIDSNYLYLGVEFQDYYNDDMTDEEFYLKAMEYAKNGNIDNAYNLLCKICRNDTKYRKDLIMLVIKYNYTEGLKTASEESFKACAAGDTEILAIINDNHILLAPKNKEDKFNYYKILYNKVSKKYAHELASAYYTLYEPAIDEEEYITYLENAAIQCETYSKELSAEYYLRLGYLHQKNSIYAGVIDKIYDNEKCLNYYKKSAELGNPEAMYTYGSFLLQNQDIDAVIKTKAVNWIKKAADMNNENAISYLFLEYYYGDLLENDYQASIKYGKRLLDISNNEMNILKANAYIGLMYYHMKNYNNAVTFLETASYQNDAIKKEFPTLSLRIRHVYSILGECYYFGTGTNKDYKKAHEMYLKELSLEENDAYVIWKLGYMYDEGIGIYENKKKAIEYYKKGASLGDVGCQSSLASCYYFASDAGYPIKKNYQKAFYWSKKAIDNGDLYSYLRLGWIYSDKNSSFYNITEAVKNFEIASKNNIGYASYCLGEIYETGSGHIQKNYKIAEKYYRLALQQGYTEAEEKLSQFQ